MDDRNLMGPETSRPPVGAQETDAPPEIPPPSNGAPGDCDELVKLEPRVLSGVEPPRDGGTAGLMFPRK
jgi:hypothetical protein